MPELWLLHPKRGFSAELAVELPAFDAAAPGRRSHRLADVPAGALVLPRFRMLPFAEELCDDIAALGAEPINSFAEHRFAADLGAWYPVFEDLTFPSWPDVTLIPADVDGPFVVKGETNSRRQLWPTHCFAADRSRLGTVIANLHADSLIGHQRLWIRRFEPLANWGSDVVGVPIAEEFRLFFFDGVELSRGFYWVNHLKLLAEAGVVPDPAAVPDGLSADIGERLRGRCRFAAVDVARRADGVWRVVEINDGAQAGLCGNDPVALFGALARGSRR